MKLKSNTIIFM